MDVPTVSIDEIPEDAHLVDVREDDEWAAGHAERAQHLPVTELAERYGELPAEEQLYVICRSGGRSARAVAWLNQSGYTAVNVAGGMGEWQARGLPLVGDSDDPHVI
ncbi:rhodanese-like domain-containing protein [Desertihabitans brevis]|uniref:Rhodanese-like domain-containing protein n=1 Tax=Desertihabitans brevis TaxID=2268447 RepID=A0A367YTN8_9ACTN|nr:rhodanese-like domain-containing protein [Desertihabitans brevis]RCK69253.1 rhodanese-like domain-containing protein [Desertihabitans brevis]